MPNWCFTTYKIVGDIKEIHDLNNKLMKLDNMKEPLVPNGFGNLWLGCLVKILGGDIEIVYCRGDITEFSYNEEDNVLTIDTQTAWAEMSEVRHFLEKVYPGLKIYYYEEEPGMEIYQTNDKHGTFFLNDLSLMILKEMAQNITMIPIHYSQLHLKFSVKS